MKRYGAAVILAGGKSARMGFDKQLIKINERRLMDSLINKLRQEFHEIIIVTNKPEYYIGLSDKITSDIIIGKGPLSGIHAGLMEASSELVYFIACDMPNINLEYIRYMKESVRDTEPMACITRFGQWIESFNAFYSKNMISAIEEHLQNHNISINSLLSKVEVHYISESEARSFSPSWDMFLNLNTKEDLNHFINNIANKY
ncbi:molybdopterin-guanine dinucleotide biosynthesis protein A [Proteiniborus ethanoligenes]|uniref:Probable molybdenum cofactor guanylyltransferase n=1 Tax=Proteiniborus ethanoligenes TaxID=415015 RepID=A0A1H3NJP0_9FIRM|nr:molybdenum cofactor guanylyltransferase [Proteiniborus ethanoligenes]SDY88963.1 molybdopterin-guanine dinucleotide biosynthesis protein A [Proteiniborus ethanoligenes]